MTSELKRYALACLFAGGLLSSCSKDKDEVEDNEEELITTVKLVFVPVGGGTTLTYQYRDVDGPGGQAPTQDEIVLAPSKSYNVSVQFLNESVSPAEDITEEVEEEDEAHRIYYEPSAASNITVGNLNNDGNGVPLGTSSTWATGAAANGTLKLTLRHYPGNPPGKSAADPVNSNKSGTDAEVTFQTAIR